MIELLKKKPGRPKRVLVPVPELINTITISTISTDDVQPIVATPIIPTPEPIVAISEQPPEQPIAEPTFNRVVRLTKELNAAVDQALIEKLNIQMDVQYLPRTLVSHVVLRVNGRTAY